MRHCVLCGELTTKKICVNCMYEIYDSKINFDKNAIENNEELKQEFIKAVEKDCTCLFCKRKSLKHNSHENNDIERYQCTKCDEKQFITIKYYYEHYDNYNLELKLENYADDQKKVKAYRKIKNNRKGITNDEE